MRDRPQGRDLALREAMGREGSEELNQYPILIPDTVPMILTQEMHSRRVLQINYLGAMSTYRNNYGRLGHREGKIIWVDYDELVHNYLPQTEKWTPMGWATTMAWLALGAPNSGYQALDPGFGGKAARDAYLMIMSSVEAKQSALGPEEIWQDVTPRP